MLNERKMIGLDEAYAVRTPADSIRLYAHWAHTYDADFVADNGYVAYLRVAEQLAKHQSDLQAAVLDVGCGTGVGGAALRDHGFATVDGIDISNDMLAVAGKKTTGKGEPVYRHLIEADLTRRVDVASDTYAGLVSAGTFTHGHLGPDSLRELWRIAAPGAVCAIGINAKHYASRGFAERIAADVASQTITRPQLVEVDMYTHPHDHVDPGNDKAVIVVCRVV